MGMVRPADPRRPRSQKLQAVPVQRRTGDPHRCRRPGDPLHPTHRRTPLDQPGPPGRLLGRSPVQHGALGLGCLRSRESRSLVRGRILDRPGFPPRNDLGGTRTVGRLAARRGRHVLLVPSVGRRGTRDRRTDRWRRSRRGIRRVRRRDRRHPLRLRIGRLVPSRPDLAGLRQRRSLSRSHRRSLPVPVRRVGLSGDDRTLGVWRRPVDHHHRRGRAHEPGPLRSDGHRTGTGSPRHCAESPVGRVRTCRDRHTMGRATCDRGLGGAAHLRRPVSERRDGHSPRVERGPGGRCPDDLGSILG